MFVKSDTVFFSFYYSDLFGVFSSVGEVLPLIIATPTLSSKTKQYRSAWHRNHRESEDQLPNPQLPLNVLGVVEPSQSDHPHPPTMYSGNRWSRMESDLSVR